MKDVRKSLQHILVLTVQGVVFEDFHQKHGFPGPLKTILTQFTAQLRKSKDERNGAKHSPLEKISKIWRTSKMGQISNFARFHDEI